MRVIFRRELCDPAILTASTRHFSHHVRGEGLNERPSPPLAGNLISLWSGGERAASSRTLSFEERIMKMRMSVLSLAVALIATLGVFAADEPARDAGAAKMHPGLHSNIDSWVEGN